MDPSKISVRAFCGVKEYSVPNTDSSDLVLSTFSFLTFLGVPPPGFDSASPMQNRLSRARSRWVSHNLYIPRSHFHNHIGSPKSSESLTSVSSDPQCFAPTAGWIVIHIHTWLVNPGSYMHAIWKEGACTIPRLVLVFYPEPYRAKARL
jgi:hypothetical protein